MDFGEVDLHCAMCEGSEVFTIFHGDSLCHHCYRQMSKTQATMDRINSERDESIQQIKKQVEEIYHLFKSSRYFSSSYDNTSENNELQP